MINKFSMQWRICCNIAYLSLFIVQAHLNSLCREDLCSANIHHYTNILSDRELKCVQWEDCLWIHIPMVLVDLQLLLLSFTLPLQSYWSTYLNHFNTFTFWWVPGLSSCSLRVTPSANTFQQSREITFKFPLLFS